MYPEDYIGRNIPIRLPEQSEKPKPPKTIFLFGAGASIPAGIPAVQEMTREFLDHPLSSINGLNEKTNLLENEKAYRRKLDVLSDIAQRHFNGTDLELLFSLIMLLQDEKTRSLFSSRYNLFDLFRKIIKNRAQHYSYDQNELLLDLKTKIEIYIRQKCETIKSVDYLWVLKGLVEERPLNIFTLNYDGTVEIFCERNGIKYTDGFEPYWDPHHFDNNTKLNLFKLHGSLYWLKSESGKAMKIPIKGLSTTNMKYLTDESVYEMLIYPQLEKNKQSFVYSWLFQKFKDELLTSDVCVVIGYSFRDNDITESIVEALSSNKKLWIVIVNPNATQLKRSSFAKYEEIMSRIVVMNAKTEEALGDRMLFPFLSKLDHASKLEETAWIEQSKSQIRMDAQYWRNIIHNFLDIDHQDHVKWIVETLSKRSFTSVDTYFPDTLEGEICVKSLKYAIQYNDKKNLEKFELWKNIFLDSCKVLEYMSFDRDNTLRIHNPIKNSDLPKKYRPSTSWSPTAIMEKFEEEMNEILHNVNSKTLAKNLDNLKKTFHLLALKKQELDGGGYIMYNANDILEKYKLENLGLTKWSNEVIKSLV